MSEFFEKVGSEVLPRTNDPRPTEAPQAVYSGAVETEGPKLDLTGQRRWAASHDVFWGATQTHNELPAGLYRCEFNPQIGPVLIRQKVETDNLLELPDEASAAIIAEFDQFWQIGEKFESRGFLHKRGFLLWGPPGSGKTSTVQILIQRLIRERDGIILFLDHPETAAKCLQMVRAIEDKRPMIAVMEDIDALVQKYGENEYLALLDGEAQVANVVFVSTTNYPERLDRRFVDRPSRFDTIRLVGMPSADARRAYLKAKESSLTPDELSRWVELSEKLSIAHLKEMIIAVRCFGQNLEDVAARLQEMRERQPKSDDAPDRSVVGFGPRAGGGLGMAIGGAVGSDGLEIRLRATGLKRHARAVWSAEAAGRDVGEGQAAKV